MGLVVCFSFLIIDSEFLDRGMALDVGDEVGVGKEQTSVPLD